MRPETAARKENVDTTGRRMQCVSTKIRNNIKREVQVANPLEEVISQQPTADCRLPTA